MQLTLVCPTDQTHCHLLLGATDGLGLDFAIPDLRILRSYLIFQDGGGVARGSPVVLCLDQLDMCRRKESLQNGVLRVKDRNAITCCYKHVFISCILIGGSSSLTLLGADDVIARAVLLWAAHCHTRLIIESGTADACLSFLDHREIRESVPT